MKTWHSAVLRVVIPYAVVAVLWILVSDNLLLGPHMEPETLQRWSIVKGLLFVTVTASLLGFLLQKELILRHAQIDARREHEAEFKTIIDSMPLALHLTTGYEQITQYVNPAMVKMFGYTMTDIPSIAEWWPLAYPDEAYRKSVSEEWNRRVAQAIETQQPIEPMETLCTCKDGSQKHIRWGYITMEEKNYSLGLDMTALRKAEDDKLQLQKQLLQSRKLESVGLLAGGVAHEFNNIIMGVIGYAELALEQLPLDHPVRHEIGELLVGARRTADLTRQLLMFARKQAIAPRPMDLNEAVSSILKMLRRLIGEGIRLVWTPGSELWPVKMDSGQVDQLLVNLCINARDAIGENGHIHIRTMNTQIDDVYCARNPEATPGEYVVCEVRDDGHGMTSEVMEHIFEPFYTTKNIGQGTGLGLASVYGAIKQNGGFIDVQSEPGKGSTFRIHFPRCTDGKTAVSVEPTGEDLPHGNETILLVEDEKSVRVTTRRLLEQLGYRVLSAGSPDDARRLVHGAEGDIDLLLTDVVMPGMSGPDLAKELQSAQSNLRTLYMSGYPEKVHMFGMKDDHTCFLPKPFTKAALARRVREAIDQPKAP